MMGNAVVVKQSFLQSQREFLRNFIRAIGEAQIFVLSPMKKQAVLRVLTKRLSITDPGVAEDTLQDLLKRLDKSLFRRSRDYATYSASCRRVIPKSLKLNSKS